MVMSQWCTWTSPRTSRACAATCSPPRAPPAPPAPPSPPAAEEVGEDGSVARITLRIPESVKTRAEELAARSGHSLNTWLVQVVRAATTADQAVNIDIDL